MSEVEGVKAASEQALLSLFQLRKILPSRYFNKTITGRKKTLLVREEMFASQTNGLERQKDDTQVFLNRSLRSNMCLRQINLPLLNLATTAVQCVLSAQNMQTSALFLMQFFSAHFSFDSFDTASMFPHLSTRRANSQQNPCEKSSTGLHRCRNESNSSRSTPLKSAKPQTEQQHKKTSGQEWKHFISAKG